MSFKDKSPAMQNLLNDLFDIGPSIQNLRCSKPPMGCGREISKEEFAAMDPDTKAEYGITGTCPSCQESLFAPFAEDDDEVYPREIPNEEYEQSRNLNEEDIPDGPDEE